MTPELRSKLIELFKKNPNASQDEVEHITGIKFVSKQIFSMYRSNFQKHHAIKQRDEIPKKVHDMFDSMYRKKPRFNKEDIEKKSGYSFSSRATFYVWKTKKVRDLNCASKNKTPDLMDGAERVVRKYSKRASSKPVIELMRCSIVGMSKDKVDGVITGLTMLKSSNRVPIEIIVCSQPQQILVLEEKV